MVLEKNDSCFGTMNMLNKDITIKDSGKILSIYQVGEDISLSCKYENFANISEISFSISKEYYELYSVFDKLYTNIINGNVLDDSILDDEVRDRMERLKNSSWYEDIVRDGVISIMSDSFPRDCPNILKIFKNDDDIILTFIQEDGREKRIFKAPFCIEIHIRQSGSTKLGDAFPIPFKTLFRDLQNVSEFSDIENVKKVKKL